MVLRREMLHERVTSVIVGARYMEQLQHCRNHHNCHTQGTREVLHGLQIPIQRFYVLEVHVVKSKETSTSLNVMHSLAQT